MSDTITPGALSHYLRQGGDAELRRRRGVVALALTATASMGLISLYQVGLIGHLPVPPVPMLNSDKVDASDESYSMFATPDSLLGMTNYAVTAVFAAVGGRDRARRRPWLSIGLAAKLLLDTAFAVRLSVQQPMKFKAWCFWCLLAAGSTVAAIPLVVPDTRVALRRVLQGA